MQRWTALALIAAAVAVAPLPVAAQAGNDSVGAVRAVHPPQAMAFARAAAAAGAYEIEAARIALEKSRDADVRHFAEAMIADHGTADETLRRTAGILELPMQPGAAQQSQLAALRTAGADFDRLYVEQQVEAHKQAVELFTAYAATGPNGALKAFAASALPVLEDHQEMVGALLERVAP